MTIKHPSLPLTSASQGDSVPTEAASTASTAASAATTPTAAPATKTAKAPPSELVVMGRIERLLESLKDAGAKGRVMRWAFEKWCDECAAPSAPAAR